MKKADDIFTHTDCVPEEMIAKYISGKLSPAEKHGVEMHLIDCEMCSDAVDGLAMIDSKRISSITSELNQKIQNRVEKKEVKVIFLRQYRTQLAVAASIALIFGLVWLFKANISMKEMDNAQAEKMFADKFVPPPAEKDEGSFDSVRMSTGKEQSELDAKNVASAQEPGPALYNITVEDAEKKGVAEEVPSYSGSEGVKAGKDVADEKHFAENIAVEDVPVQKAGQLRKGVVTKKTEEKEAQDYYGRNKYAESPNGNVTTESKRTTRDEDNDGVKDEIAKVTVTDELQKNEFESLKEKDKKADESKKSPPATTSNTEGTTTLTPKSVDNAIVSGSAWSNAPVQDKSVSSADKQETTKPSDDRERADANNVSRGRDGEGDVLAYKKETKSGGKGKEAKGEQLNLKFKKSPEPQKVSGGYFNTQTVTSSPLPETKTSETQTIAGEGVSGTVMMDSVSVNITALGTAVLADGQVAKDSGMIKYDMKDYAGAVYDFEKALRQNANDEKALYYSAVSYLSLGQTDKALANFNKILLNKNSKYYDDAQWYSSLAYIKNNDMKNARTNLQQIQQNEKSRYKKQADETLQQIKK